MILDMKSRRCNNIPIPTPLINVGSTFRTGIDLWVAPSIFEGVLNTPAFRLHLVMSYVIITNYGNLPWFEYFRKIALTTSLRKARRGRHSSPSSFLIWCYTHTSWRTTSTIKTNGDHQHFFVWIPILYLTQWNWFSCSRIYFLSTLFQHWANLLGSQDSEEAM